jgi:hypothetical protein
VKVWLVMRSANLHIHPNDDTEEAADLWHASILLRARTPSEPPRFSQTRPQESPRSARLPEGRKSC